MNNRKTGNSFEAEFCEKLFQNGYWVHNLAQNAAGQPADVVAVKNGVPYLIDCKVCSGKVFSVSRIKNTITVEFKVSERYPDFAEKIKFVENWWAEYVDSGISPVYDEKKDAELLVALRTHNLTPDTDINALITEAEGLKGEIDKTTAAIADKEKRLGEINNIIKEHAMKQFRPGDKKVEVKGATYTWAISRSETTTIDKKALEADGLLDKYQKKTEQFRMTVK